MNQPCKYEGDIAILKSDVPEIKRDVKEILNMLQDNGGEGLFSKVKGMKVQQKIQWWFIGGISMCVLTTAIILLIKKVVAGGAAPDSPKCCR